MMTRITTHASNQISALITNRRLNAAFGAVYTSRNAARVNSDIWCLSLNWPAVRRQLQSQLLAGTYQLLPVQVYQTDQGYLSQLGSQDPVVLKALSTLLAPLVAAAVGPRYHHLRDHGGLKGAVRRVGRSFAKHTTVIKSDVHQFYDSMQHTIVLAHCQKIIKDKRILLLISQYLNRCEVLDGDHRLIEQGIPKGCPLSPLMGALMLKSLDACVPADTFYARYMDDWVILVKSRAQLRRMVKKMHQVMHRLKFKLAQNKTFIGRIQKGFDFLGYRFNHQGLIGLASKTIQNFIERLRSFMSKALMISAFDGMFDVGLVGVLQGFDSRIAN